MPKKILTTVGILLLLITIAIGVNTFVTRNNKKELIPPVPAASAIEKADSIPVFDKTQLSITDPSSFWIVVNKHRALNPIAYVPVDLAVPNVAVRDPGKDTMQLRKAAAEALKTMSDAAKTDGLSLMLFSGYRSYQYQTGVYNTYVSRIGSTETDKVSARPGYSEHQTGLAADVEPASGKCTLDVCFADLPEGIWIASNAYKYGFIIRYPKDKTPVTGYSYEPWHLRFVGTDLSNEMHSKSITTLEEFFDFPPAPDYQ